MRRLELTAAARADLLTIWRYTKTRWGRDQADRYLALIDRGLATLARGSGKTIRQRTTPYFSFKVASHHLFFREDDDLILVVRVLHERMDAPRHLPD